jgi:hypothetical protein
LCPKEFVEVILAKGHENITATHQTTLEITKDTHLTRMGDCIIAVDADKAIEDLSVEFRKNLVKNASRLTMLIEAGGIADTVTAYGSPNLKLMHPSDIVVRKSIYICNRTLAIRADKAAQGLSRELVNQLRNSRQKVKITLSLSV